MQLHEYLAQDGAQAKMAADLAISTAQVWQWKDGRRPVPYEYGAAIEKSTDGKVTRKDLFPDAWGRIWPELAVQATAKQEA
jgi:DNA-binding transcriptional regulator YdaS (Cro superfamily)